ncbi:hypothetical protein [Candidatus Vondammii sp. HM_W22]|uniref:hypothetical protein n=1 Tax=Candidatus Vondammii sp. HM_W22 TaxID=2687299 RepID=UPI001F145FA3|nr:hypothetical protein [Candidatus Vondammii sp. HM_W22]
MRDKDLHAQILGIKLLAGQQCRVGSVREVTVQVEQEAGAKQCCSTCGAGLTGL